MFGYLIVLFDCDLCLILVYCLLIVCFDSLVFLVLVGCVRVFWCLGSLCF